ncbi:MAG: glycosyltransferase 87 family protein [Anaerolineae bacterium]
MAREKSPTLDVSPGIVQLRRFWNASATLPVLGLALAAHVAVVLTLYFSPIYRADLSTLPADFDRATRIIHTGLLYRDFAFEYPPLAAFFYGLPGLFAQTVEAFRAAFAVQMAVVDMLTVVLTWLWLRRMRRAAVPPLAAQAVFLAGLGTMVVLERFDLAPAALVLLGLLLWEVGRLGWAWAMLGLGTGIKLFPIVVVPIFALDYVRERKWRALGLGILAFVVAAVIPGLPFFLAAPEGLAQLTRYHGARGVQIESLTASPLLLGHLAGYKVTSVFAFGSQEVTSDWSAWAALLALPLIVAALALVFWRYWRGSAVGERRLQFAAAAILAFMLFNKVLSAQYLVWLYPLIPLVVARRYAVWTVYLGAIVLTQYLYPHGWNDLTALHAEAIAVQVTRNALLLVLWGLLLVEGKQGRSEGVAG